MRRPRTLATAPQATWTSRNGDGSRKRLGVSCVCARVYDFYVHAYARRQPPHRPSRCPIACQSISGSTMLGVGSLPQFHLFLPRGAGGVSYAPRLPRTYPSVRGTSTVSICSIPSTQYTATRRIKSDYTRSAMWPSVAGESCESREAWAASLTTSCHLRLPVSRLHHPSHRHAQFQPPTSMSARPFDAADLTTARPSDGAQMAPRGAAPREPAVHAWRARVAW